MCTNLLLSITLHSDTATNYWAHMSVEKMHHAFNTLGIIKSLLRETDLLAKVSRLLEVIYFYIVTYIIPDLLNGQYIP